MIEPRSPSFRSYGFTVSLNNFDLSASRFFVEQRIPPCISVTSTETLLPQLFNCPTYTRHVKTSIARFGHKRKKPTPLSPFPKGDDRCLDQVSETCQTFNYQRFILRTWLRTSLRESREYAFNHSHPISLNHTPKYSKIV